MTNETGAQEILSFPTRSRASQLARDLFVVALSAAIVGGFLAHAWRTPEPPANPVASVAAVEPRP